MINSPVPPIKARRVDVGSKRMDATTDGDPVVACAVKLDDSVVCWGDNPSPVQGGPLLRAKEIAVGSHRAVCVTDHLDRLRCWGSHGGAPIGTRFRHILMTYRSGIGVTEEGEVVVWGAGYVGQAQPPIPRVLM